MRNSLVFILLSVTASLSFAELSPNTPESWYQLPEQSLTAGNYGFRNNDTNEDTTKLEQAVDAIFRADSNAVENGIAGSYSLDTSGSTQKPKDWVPWRAEVFTTDLSLSVGGLLGVLMTKGTATVRAYWRKQNPVAHKSSNFVSPEEKENDDGTIKITDETTVTDMTHQIESVIKIAAKAKKVEDTPLLRAELLNTAKDFQNLSYSLNQTNQNLPWWVQRFRVDFTVDASGHVNPTVTVGGEVRFRFEWHRIKRKSGRSLAASTPIKKTFVNQEALNTFVKNMSEDLDQAFTWMPEYAFQAHTVRMGLGISAKGDIGVVRGSAGVVGQIYFTRDVKRPTKNPPLPASLASNNGLLLIERDPSQQSLNFADHEKIKYDINTVDGTGSYFGDPIKEAVYKINRENFRNGLKRAAKISKFFVKRASKQHGAGWKIYELRTSFDASISGELTMATLQGAVTAQVAFFNQKF